MLQQNLLISSGSRLIENPVSRCSKYILMWSELGERGGGGGWGRLVDRIEENDGQTRLICSLERTKTFNKINAHLISSTRQGADKSFL